MPIGKGGIILALLFLVGLSHTSLWAGDWHFGTGMVCSQCHTMHNSQNGAPMRYDNDPTPANYLLRHSSVSSLCLYCHDGGIVNAPDVFSPIATSYAPDEFSGGGFFARPVGVANPTGHDLGLGVSVPLSNLSSMTLNCTTCHDPHGTRNYRNLRSSPSGRTNVPIVMNNPSQPTDDVFVNVRPDGSNPGAGYRRSNTGYKAKMAAWCAECHDSLASNSIGTSPAHFMRHPSNVALNASGYHTAPTNWTGGTSQGFGAITGDSTAGIPRTRFQGPTATNFTESTTVAASNEVFCPSCHLAHGSNYKGGLLWPFKEGGADMMAPCQQCHNQ